jgi:hypothetical protein
MAIKNYKPRTVKLEAEDDLRLKNLCRIRGVDVSTFIREAVTDKMNSSHISNIAGKNRMEYVPEKDSFVWKIELDNGEESTIIDNISVEFLNDLCSIINLKLNDRDKLLEKKKKGSVSVPRRLIKK